MRAHLVAELDRLGAGKQAHSGRSLRDHLIGTAALLEQWGCESDVCAAGLFHSIYGTNAFTATCLSGNEREHLRNVLGERAERLAFLFGACARPSALLLALAGNPLLDRRTGEDLCATGAELRDLMAIECANLLEQSDTCGLLTILRRLPAPQRQALLGASVSHALSSLSDQKEPQ